MIRASAPGAPANGRPVSGGYVYRGTGRDQLSRRPSPRDRVCDTCGALPGDPCFTANGRQTAFHAARKRER